ncbi:MAG: GNAT family N-acetyltransferase [Bacteroidota bacterium]
MSENVLIRQAEKKDFYFLADCILSADQSNGAHSSYTQIFDVSKEAFHAILLQMLDEELEGTELSPVHFLIAEINNIPVAAVSSWVEGAYDAPSWMIRSGLFREYIPQKNIDAASSIKVITDEMVLQRTEGTLQIEAVYTHPDYRGKGYASMLIYDQAKRKIAEFPELKIVELMLYLGNDAAARAYEKLGFVEKQSKICNHPDVLKYYPSLGMRLMQCDIQKLLI